MLRTLGHLLLAVALAIPATAAADVPWQSKTYRLVARDQPLDELLRQFGADQGLTVVVSEKVKGDVSGNFGPMEPQKFLELITSANGLIWFFDGNSLFIYRNDEVENRLIPLQYVEPERMKVILTRLGISWNERTLRDLEDEAVVYVVGPPRYIELVGDAVKLFESLEESKRGVELKTLVVPLKYAWAEDQTFTFADAQVVVPGVATILRNLQDQSQGQPAPGSAYSSRSHRRTRDKLKGTGLIARGRDEIPQGVPQEDEIVEARTRAQQDARLAPGGPVPGDPRARNLAPDGATRTLIQADTRINAVVLRDTEADLERYQDLIEQLDRPTGLVQIAATIVDVDRDYNFNFGPPYAGEIRDGGSDLFGGTFNFTPGEEGNFSATLVKNGASQFLAQVRALEAAGHANVLSQPSVLTLDNVEAQLSDTQTFFVRVAGDREVDLFDVTVGTTLKVVPHVVDEAAGPKVKLIVRVEDGSFEDQTVDDIPVIRQGVINTQAVLNEEESLLIGGLLRERDVETKRALPVLGRIPHVGFLFRVTETERQRTERMLLITPRIVQLRYNENQRLPATNPPQVPCMPPIPNPFPRLLPGCDDEENCDGPIQFDPGANEAQGVELTSFQKTVPAKRATGRRPSPDQAAAPNTAAANSAAPNTAVANSAAGPSSAISTSTPAKEPSPKRKDAQETRRRWSWLFPWSKKSAPSAPAAEPTANVEAAAPPSRPPLQQRPDRPVESTSGRLSRLPPTR